MLTVICNRCNKLASEDDACWLSLEVHPSEAELLHVPDRRIDLCSACEGDFREFMSGKAFHKFMERERK